MTVCSNSRIRPTDCSLADDDDGSTLNLRAMLSPDPLMGKSGYPLLLAAGETANGVDPLVDRQHPHDFFMELSASYSKRLSEKDSLYGYIGLPGEPAFGPPAFMHRMSAMDSPEAPITHHWLDSTHIVFGVTTLGWAHDRFKIETSAFKGREPDEERWGIDEPKLDSWSVRASWNPSSDWALQASYADVSAPEQLEPDEDETKWSASVLHTRRLGETGWWSSTLAWGRKTNSHDESKDGWLLESALHPNDRWTVFARAERIERREEQLLPEDAHDDEEQQHEHSERDEIGDADAQHVAEEEVEEISDVVRDRREERDAECEHPGEQDADDRVGSQARRARQDADAERRGQALVHVAAAEADAHGRAFRKVVQGDGDDEQPDAARQIFRLGRSDRQHVHRREPVHQADDRGPDQHRRRHGSRRPAARRPARLQHLHPRHDQREEGGRQHHPGGEA